MLQYLTARRYALFTPRFAMVHDWQVGIPTIYAAKYQRGSLLITSRNAAHVIHLRESDRLLATTALLPNHRCGSGGLFDHQCSP